ncbi:helix-turn-helix domain-containing protein [Streptomyces sp. NPDC091279]|uniref:helix-turn-helix domain-containing protein n=1 Tax=unclassified Streptomyces TaxID=2593676 RepID=UPI003826DBD4
MEARKPVYRLVGPDLLRTLMQRTGTGAPVAIRELATAAGVSHSTIGHLLTGQRRNVPLGTAHAIAQRIGVDLLVLFVPVPSSAPPPHPAQRLDGDG